MSEELGIEDVELKKVTKFYTEQDYGGRILREFSMLYTTQFDGDMKLSKREIMDGLWHPLVKIDEMINRNIDDFPPGFVKAFKEYKKSLSSN